VSLAFTALAFVPLALLALWLLATGGLTLSAFPSGAGALWALLFHGGIGALLVLYWLFWTTINLAQTLPIAIGLGVATAGVGYKALSAVADMRLQQERAGASAVKKTN
jgi:oligosaccharyltransferase complex subunit delta (ribophorin II)